MGYRNLVAISSLVLAASMAGCSDGRQQAESDPAPTADVATAGVPAALDFTAPLIGGGEFEGAAYAERPVMFWFWAPT